MTDPTALVEVDSVHALLGLAELQGVEVYELRGRELVRPEDADFHEGFVITAAIDAAPDQIKTRFMLTFSSAVGEYYVNLAVRYVFSVPALVPKAVAVEFAEKVGIMTAFPFLREHVYNLASRLGHSVPVLGLLKQGQLTLTNDVRADAT